MAVVVDKTHIYHKECEKEYKIKRLREFISKWSTNESHKDSYELKN